MSAAARLARILLVVLAGLLCLSGAAASADLSCNGLVPSGRSMICAGSEPNWAIVLRCRAGSMKSAFLDAFSGAGIVEKPGTVIFFTQDPWSFSTSHPVSGTIASTPASCHDESDRTFDFTFTPGQAPGLDGPFFPFCCRIDR